MSPKNGGVDEGNQLLGSGTKNNFFLGLVAGKGTQNNSPAKDNANIAERSESETSMLPG